MGKRFYLGMCLPMLRETELFSKRNLFNYDYIEALCWCTRAASQVHIKSLSYGRPSREAVGLNGQTLLSPKKWPENSQ